MTNKIQSKIKPKKQTKKIKKQKNRKKEKYTCIYLYIKSVKVVKHNKIESKTQKIINKKNIQDKQTNKQHT